LSSQSFDEAATIGALIREIRRCTAAISSSPMEEVPAQRRWSLARRAHGSPTRARVYGRACALGAEAAHPASSVIAVDGDCAVRGDLIAEIARRIVPG
jgi:hypothetical protein